VILNQYCGVSVILLRKDNLSKPTACIHNAAGLSINKILITDPRLNIINSNVPYMKYWCVFICYAPKKRVNQLKER
jgi:hypothetical protein